MSGLAKRIEDAQKNLVNLRDSLATHVETLGDNPTDEQVTTTEQLSTQIEQQEKSLASMQKAEAHLARAANSTALVTIQQNRGSEQDDTSNVTVQSVRRQVFGGQDTALSARGRAFASAGKKVTPLDCLFKAVTVDLKHFGEGRKRHILEVLKDEYGDNEMGENIRTIMSQMVTKAASVPADTVTSGWASQLVQTVIGEFIEALMPLSIYPKLAARGASFTFGRNGVISLPSRTTSTSMGGAFVAQGAPIPVKQGAFSAISLTPKKMGVITTLTREITEHSTPAI